MSPLGEAQNVKVTNEEFSKLVARFGEGQALDWIEKLSLWKASKGRRFKSDYFAILSWARKDLTVQTAVAPTLGLAPGIDHEHRCPACYERPHKWHCGGVDGDGYPCQMSQTVACNNYFKELDVKKRQGKLAL